MESAIDEIFAKIRRLCSGEWQTIRDIDRLEATILVERRRLPALNRILLTEKSSSGCNGRLAKIRNSELSPLRSYLMALGAPAATRFRFIDTPCQPSEIDVRVCLNQTVKNLQITLALPSVLQSNDGAKHGQQYRLRMAELAETGWSIGAGPFVRNCAGQYVKTNCIYEGDDLRDAVRNSLIRAIRIKRRQHFVDVSLLIYGVDFGFYGIEIFDEFQKILESEIDNSNYAEIILVCSSPARIWTALV